MGRGGGGTRTHTACDLCAAAGAAGCLFTMYARMLHPESGPHARASSCTGANPRGRRELQPCPGQGVPAPPLPAHSPGDIDVQAPVECAAVCVRKVVSIQVSLSDSNAIVAAGRMGANGVAGSAARLPPAHTTIAPPAGAATQRSAGPRGLPSGSEGGLRLPGPCAQCTSRPCWYSAQYTLAPCTILALAGSLRAAQIYIGRSALLALTYGQPRRAPSGPPAPEERAQGAVRHSSPQEPDSS